MLDKRIDTVTGLKIDKKKLILKIKELEGKLNNKLEPIKE